MLEQKNKTKMWKHTVQGFTQGLEQKTIRLLFIKYRGSDLASDATVSGFWLSPALFNTFPGGYYKIPDYIFSFVALSLSLL